MFGSPLAHFSDQHLCCHSMESFSLHEGHLLYTDLLCGVGHHGVNTKTGIRNRSRVSSCVFLVAGSLFICFESFPYSVTLSNGTFVIV